MNIQPQQQAQISPLAILAAVLFNAKRTEKIKIKMDDASPEIEMESACLGIEQDDEALVCAISMDKIAKFACIPYDFKFQVDQGVALIMFEKQKPISGLVTATGQRVATESTAIHNLIRKLQLGSEVVADGKDPE